MLKRPMLAAKYESLAEVQLPTMVSPKLDGIRCVIVQGQPLTRKMKPLPNRHLRAQLAELPSFDGEIIIPGGSFSDVQSAVMAEYGEPEFEYHVFDNWELPEPFHRRLARVEAAVGFLRSAGRQFLRVVPHYVVTEPAELEQWEQRFLSEGYEGIIFRHPDGPYKQNRSTVREGWLGKLKRFETNEFEVVGYEEQMQNLNEATLDERGYTKRSSAAEGKVGKDTLGALVLRDPASGLIFSCGTGFDDSLRAELWARRDQLVGRLAVIKHQPHGALDAPRFPVFVGFRDELDTLEEEQE